MTAPTQLADETYSSGSPEALTTPKLHSVHQRTITVWPSQPNLDPLAAGTPVMIGKFFEYLTSWLDMNPSTITFMIIFAVALVNAIRYFRRKITVYRGCAYSTCIVGLFSTTFLGHWSDGHNYTFSLLLVLLSLSLYFDRRTLNILLKLQSLSLLIRGRPKQDPTALIWRLPPEIIQYMADSFPPVTAATFALTSKTILNIIGHQHLAVEGQARLKLLELFQADFPDHLLCHQCRVFHTKASMAGYRHNDCLYANGYVEMTWGALLFYEAQQAMNRHLYGKRHSVTSNYVSRWHIGSSEHSSMRVSGNIMLLRQHLRLNSRTRDITICPHIGCSEIANAPSRTWVHFACPICGTEVSGFCRRKDVYNEEINVYIYRSLGPCRNPFEPQWRLVTEHAMGRRGGSTDHKLCLQSQWNRLQDLAEPSDLETFSLSFPDRRLRTY